MTAEAEGAPAPRRYAKRLPRETRRELLLDAALALIVREGFGALTMARVAAEADIAKSVVYAVFDDQAALQHALMAREQDRAFALSQRAITAAGAAGDPLTALRAGLSVFLEGVAAAPDTWRLVFLPAAGTPAAIQQAIRDGRERWRLVLEPVVSGHVGRLGVDVGDPELAAHVVRGNVEYLARLVLEEPERFPPERLTAFIDTLGARLLGAR